MARNSRHWKALSFLVLLAAAAACGKTDEETRLFLERQLKTEKSDDALKKIRNLIDESNRQHSVMLSDNRRKNRPLGVSGDGDTLFWREDTTLFYRPAGGEEIRRMELPGVPVQLKLSFHGRFGLAVYRETTDKKKVCRLLPLSLREGRPLGESLLVTGCESKPAISDRGVLYYGRGGALYHQQTVVEKADPTILESPGRDVLPAKAFPEKYKKIKNRFTVYDLPGEQLLIFHGAAGFYRLYHYPGSGGKVTRLAENISRAQLYPVVHHIRLKAPPPKPGQPADAAETPAPGLRLREPRTPAFNFYQGAAGKYSLRRIEIGKRIKLGQAVKLRPLEAPVYVENEKAYLILRNDLACLWPPGKRLEYLPLETANLLAYNDGLAYEDTEGRLLLRAQPFTNHEQELLQLKFQAEKQE